MIQTISIKNFETKSGVFYGEIPLSFEFFGQNPENSPVVLVTHALTGNSDVASENGWWNLLIGKNKCINTEDFSILAFNIPGNGFDGFIVENYKDFSVYDVAQIFLKGLEQLQIKSLFAGIGGSLGGSILWQMAVLEPNLMQNLIPIATDWKATDWLLAQCRIQKEILENSSKPLHDARLHAMTLYRTPQSFSEKFKRGKHETLGIFNVESWLLHHGEKLQKRFQLKAYKLMNWLLITTDITDGTENFEESVKNINSQITLIGIDTDWFYTDEEIIKTHQILLKLRKKASYHQIKSIHGHDAFLIEYEQLSQFLKPIFKKINNEYSSKI